MDDIQVTIYFTPMRRGEHRLVVLGADGCEDDDFCWRGKLGGGNSNIFYFHPENWGNDPT